MRTVKLQLIMIGLAAGAQLVAQRIELQFRRIAGAEQIEPRTPVRLGRHCVDRGTAGSRHDAVLVFQQTEYLVQGPAGNPEFPHQCALRRQPVG
ncbi:hypothetical protein SDC9_110926 [bioreactor metagenome]|uniref:Uncharacterized protein n=1 Tax=bioreactor metagenome TaxID=1076179 RepID=A0A645BF12_9ZZZZ